MKNQPWILITTILSCVINLNINAAHHQPIDSHKPNRIFSHQTKTGFQRRQERLQKRAQRLKAVRQKHADQMARTQKTREPIKNSKASRHNLINIEKNTPQNTRIDRLENAKERREQMRLRKTTSQDRWKQRKQEMLNRKQQNQSAKNVQTDF